jgi:hypothetical protein
MDHQVLAFATLIMDLQLESFIALNKIVPKHQNENPK